MKSNYYFFVLDIETSKELSYDKKLGKDMPFSVWLSYGVCKLYDVKNNVKSVCKFREWKELYNYLYFYNFTFKKDIVCYVHNLSYEFDFLIKNLSKPKTFLCNNSHKVISAVLEELPKIEFRCSYQLSAKSLKKIGKMLNFPKLESEYRTIYPEDVVTSEEWEYCERDCDIVAKYINFELEEYKMLSYLPLTSTGKVRKDLKDLLKLYPDNREWDKYPPLNCYDALVKTFNGAITMSNPRFTNIHIKRKIRCFDEKSKYPSILLCKEFPYTIEKQENFTKEDINNNKFWLAKVRFINLVSKYDFGFISTSTIEYFDFNSLEIFNGKIINCNCIEKYITNIDFETIKLNYDFSDFEILEFYPCKNYGKLPTAFYELIKKYAQPKYELKIKLQELEKDGKEDTKEYRDIEIEYTKSKNKLNSVYGMMVQKLISPEYKIDDNYLWYEVLPEYNIKDKKLNRNFLYGIYNTSYARYDLINNIVKNCPNNFVYCDTDSIKYIDIGKEFIDYNENIPKEFDDLPYLHNFNKFEEETSYDEFITYGAKKYAYIKHGIFGYTVAGLPKKKELNINSFDVFTLGTTYKNCKLAKRYIFNNFAFDFDYMNGDYLETVEIERNDFELRKGIKTHGGIALFETDYKLNMTKGDLKYIERNRDIWEKRNIQQNILI